MVQLSDLDDLSLQFNGTDAGRRFIEAWKCARNIVDAGHGPPPPNLRPRRRHQRRKREMILPPD
jgi:hypothetical protein